MAKILVVDDELDIREGLAKMLSMEGHTPLTVSNGAEAVTAVETQHPELALMDIRMPDMSGLEALEAIRKLDPRLPVIMHTAFYDYDLMRHAILLGVNDYIVKPAEPREIIALIDKFLRRRALFFVEEENGGTILIANVRTLSIHLSRVVNLEEHLRHGLI